MHAFIHKSDSSELDSQILLEQFSRVTKKGRDNVSDIDKAKIRTSFKNKTIIGERLRYRYSSRYADMCENIYVYPIKKNFFLIKTLLTSYEICANNGVDIHRSLRDVFSETKLGAR